MIEKIILDPSVDSLGFGASTSDLPHWRDYLRKRLPELYPETEIEVREQQTDFLLIEFNGTSSGREQMELRNLLQQLVLEKWSGNGY